jgi:hypothetical protein
VANRLLACGAAAGSLFTLSWLVEGATRAGYDLLRHPVSSLALGERGWTQRATFLVTGLLTIALAVGLRRALRPRGGSRWGTLLVGAVGIGLMGAGVFATDPLSGYPPGTPGLPPRRSVAGVLHDLFGTPVFLGLPAACFVFASRFAQWGERRWMRYSAATGLIFVTGFVVTSIAFGQNERLVAYGGLFQRVTLTTGWLWLTLLALHLRTRSRPKASLLNRAPE